MGEWSHETPLAQHASKRSYQPRGRLQGELHRPNFAGRLGAPSALSTGNAGPPRPDVRLSTHALHRLLLEEVRIRMALSISRRIGWCRVSWIGRSEGRFHCCNDLERLFYPASHLADAAIPGDATVRKVAAYACRSSRPAPGISSIAIEACGNRERGPSGGAVTGTRHRRRRENRHAPAKKSSVGGTAGQARRMTRREMEPGRAGVSAPRPATAMQARAIGFHRPSS